MGKYRLEAFSDGVTAIIITIMVLELEVPAGSALADLLPLLPTLLSYLLSFLYVGIYWNNHHHTLHTIHRVTGPIMWANLHWLFWLSLFPFTTAWMGQNNEAPWPTTLYAFVLLMTAIAYFILQGTIIRTEGEGSRLKQAVGHDLKGKISVTGYFLAVCTGLVWPFVAQIIFVALAILWIKPDHRIENLLQRLEQGD